MSTKGTALFAVATVILVAFTAFSYLEMDEPSDADGQENSRTIDTPPESNDDKTDDQDMWEQTDEAPFTGS